MSLNGARLGPVTTELASPRGREKRLWGVGRSECPAIFVLRYGFIFMLVGYLAVFKPGRPFPRPVVEILPPLLKHWWSLDTISRLTAFQGLPRTVKQRKEKARNNRLPRSRLA